jgi:hypothetical protein
VAQYLLVLLRQASFFLAPECKRICSRSHIVCWADAGLLPHHSAVLPESLLIRDVPSHLSASSTICPLSVLTLHRRSTSPRNSLSYEGSHIWHILAGVH